MNDFSLIPISVTQHAKVINQIEAGEMNAARDVLEENWRFGMEALLRKL